MPRALTGVSRPFASRTHPRGDRSSLVTPLLVAFGSVLVWAIFAARYVPIHDAITYLAAGERLNAGHALYSLTLGDRVLAVTPAFFSAPLLSPPLVAVLWRPLAAIPEPFGVAIWLVAHAIAMTWLIAVTARSWRSALVVVIASMGIGMELVTGNLTGFLAAGYALVWLFRDRPWIGAVIAAMVALKLMPIVLLGFLFSRRDWRAFAWFLLGSGAALLVLILGAGFGSIAAYVDVMRSTLPQPWSIPYVVGAPWLSPVLVAIGAVLAALLPERWSFRTCIATIIIAAPTLGWAYAITVLPLLLSGNGVAGAEAVRSWRPSRSSPLLRAKGTIDPHVA